MNDIPHRIVRIFWYACIVLCIACSPNESPRREFSDAQSMGASPDESGQSEQVQSLILNERDLRVEFQSDPKAYALVMAALAGDVERVQELIGQGANPNLAGLNGLTPLHYTLGNLQGFAEILKAGGDPNLQSSEVAPVIDYAILHDNLQFLKLCLQYGGDPSLRVSYINDTLLINAIKLGAVSAITKDGRTQVPPKIELLVNAGADLNDTSAFDRPPVEAAFITFQYDVALFLIQQGAKIPPSLGSLANQQEWNELVAKIKERSNNYQIAALHELREHVRNSLNAMSL